MRLALTALAAATLLAAALPASAQKHKASELVVSLKTSTGQDAGTATFRETMGHKLNIKLNLKNLPEGDHAVHIHANPVCDAPDFKGAGGHFNPDKKQHGTKNPAGHHNGDLPENISVGMDGTATKSFTVDYLSMTMSCGSPADCAVAHPDTPNNILANGGTAIVVHQKADDMMTDPTGNAGNRIACGVITPHPPPPPPSPPSTSRRCLSQRSLTAQGAASPARHERALPFFRYRESSLCDPNRTSSSVSTSGSR